MSGRTINSSGVDEIKPHRVDYKMTVSVSMNADQLAMATEEEAEFILLISNAIQMPCRLISLKVID